MILFQVLHLQGHLVFESGELVHTHLGGPFEVSTSDGNSSVN